MRLKLRHWIATLVVAVAVHAALLVAYRTPAPPQPKRATGELSVRLLRERAASTAPADLAKGPQPTRATQPASVTSEDAQSAAPAPQSGRQASSPSPTEARPVGEPSPNEPPEPRQAPAAPQPAEPPAPAPPRPTADRRGGQSEPVPAEAQAKAVQAPPASSPEPSVARSPASRGIPLEAQPQAAEAERVPIEAGVPAAPEAPAPGAPEYTASDEQPQAIETIARLSEALSLRAESVMQAAPVEREAQDKRSETASSAQPPERVAGAPKPTAPASVPPPIGSDIEPEPTRAASPQALAPVARAQDTASGEPLGPQRLAERVQIRTPQIQPVAPSEVRASEIAPSATTARDATASEDRQANRPPSHGTTTDGVDVARIEANYLRTLRAWLERNKDYPQYARQRGLEGTVVLHVEMAHDGDVLSFHIVRSSGYFALDDAVARMIENSTPLPALPAGIRRERLEFKVPISFSLGG